MNIEEKVEGILSEISGIKRVSSKDTLLNNLALDSLQMVVILLEIEKTFGIELDESDLNPFELVTVNDVIDLVKKYISKD